MFAVAWVLAGVDTAKERIRRKRERKRGMVIDEDGDDEGGEWIGGKEWKIYLTLFHRGRLSLLPQLPQAEEDGEGVGKERVGKRKGEERVERFHWGLLFAPSSPGLEAGEGALPGRGTHIDVTDAVCVDPVKKGVDMLNMEEGEWRMRCDRGWAVEGDGAGRVICLVEIGRVEGDKVGEVVKRLEGEVRVPRRDGDGGSENCVWWVLQAVEVLKEIGLVGEEVEVDALRREGMRMGGDAMEDLKKASKDGGMSKARVRKYKA